MKAIDIDPSFYEAYAETYNFGDEIPSTEITLCPHIQIM